MSAMERVHLQERYCSSTEIRAMFSSQLSDMYKLEVPLYGDLLDLVSEVNTKVLTEDPALQARLQATDQLERLHLERHGAIRLGSIEELTVMARFLRIMGMFPVGYYDLARAGLPVHATCFRTMDSASLSQNPFRLFVSLLRASLLSEPTRDKAQDLVSRRQIFNNGALELIVKAEKNQSRLEPEDAIKLVSFGIETFKWHASATVTIEEYRELNSEAPLLADIVCFRGPHVNHLTPRTLDIDLIQETMIARGFPAKAVIEGPPRRRCPILLRQTSFKALEERINYIQADGNLTVGAHVARFGEIEERGAALTRKGRDLYDRIMNRCRSENTNALDKEKYNIAFADFPDDWESIRRNDLAWFRYSLADTSEQRLLAPYSLHMAERFETELHWFLMARWVKYEPIVYEDFLPLSAAGIFESNLANTSANGQKKGIESASDHEVFLRVLQGGIEDEMTNYSRLQQESLDMCKRRLIDIVSGGG